MIKKILPMAFILWGIYSSALAATSQTVSVGLTSDYTSIASALAQSNIGDGTQEAERDTIVIQDGTYSLNSDMATFVDVNNKNFITIRAETMGGVTITSDNILFRWQNSEFVTIQGINITGGAAMGVFFFNNNFILDTCNVENTNNYGVRFGGDVDKSIGAAGHSHTIVNCKFNNNGDNADGGDHGILIQNTSSTSWTQRTLVSKCELSGNGEDGIQTAGARDNSNADEDHIAAYIEIRNCKINNNNENGIDLKASRYIRVHHNEINGNVQAAIVIHSPENSGAPDNTGCFKNAIYNNWVADNNSRGIQIGDGDYTRLSYNLIFNNVIIRNRSAGVWAPDGKKVGGDQIFFNTILNTTGSGTSSWEGGWGIPYEEDNLDNPITNNIVFGNNNPGFKAVRTFTKINNLLDNDGQSWPNNHYTTNPKFLDVQNDDYHLASDSPARNLIFTGQILTAEQVQEYKALLGNDLPISVNGPTIDFEDLHRINYPGAYGSVNTPIPTLMIKSITIE